MATLCRRLGLAFSCKVFVFPRHTFFLLVAMASNLVASFFKCKMFQVCAANHATPEDPNLWKGQNLVQCPALKPFYQDESCQRLQCATQAFMFSSLVSFSRFEQK